MQNKNYFFTCGTLPLQKSIDNTGMLN